MEITKEQKNKLIQFVKIYPKKSDFSKLKAEIDTGKIVGNFILIIKPFLVFAISKDKSFKELFNFLDNDEFKQLYALSERLLKDSYFGKYRDIKKLSELVFKNREILDELNNLFLDLNLKEDVDPTSY